MKTDFEFYRKLKRGVQDWILGNGRLSDIASLLDLKPSSLDQMMTWCGLSDISGRPLEGITDQDVINAICLVYIATRKGRKDL